MVRTRIRSRAEVAVFRGDRGYPKTGLIACGECSRQRAMVRMERDERRTEGVGTLDRCGPCRIIELEMEMRTVGGLRVEPGCRRAGRVNPGSDGQRWRNFPRSRSPPACTARARRDKQPYKSPLEVVPPPGTPFWAERAVSRPHGTQSAGRTHRDRGGALPRHRPPMPPPSEHASDASAAVSGVIARY